MKHPKRINLAMKKLITANGLNPKDYWFLKNTIDSLVIIHKETSKVITLKKWTKWRVLRYSMSKVKFLRVTIPKSVDKSIESMEFQEYKKFNTFRGYK